MSAMCVAGSPTHDEEIGPALPLAIDPTRSARFRYLRAVQRRDGRIRVDGREPALDQQLDLGARSR